MLQGIENIDKIIFINLKKRTDRLEQIMKEFEKLQIHPDKILRIEAIEDRNGALGCAKSHLEIVKYARLHNFSNILILEDDFSLNVDPHEFHEQLTEFFKRKINYDVVMMAYNLKLSHYYDDLISHTISAYTTSAYLVHHDFYDKLIQCYEECIENLTKEPNNHQMYAIDSYWQKLQNRNNNWYHFNKRLSKQRPSLSDITGLFENYQV